MSYLKISGSSPQRKVYQSAVLIVDWAKARWVSYLIYIITEGVEDDEIYVIVSYKKAEFED